jgi:hypothetical protein
MSSKRSSGEARKSNRNDAGSGLEAATQALFDLVDQFSADFLQPGGPFVSPDSVSRCVFEKPAVAFHWRAEPHVRTAIEGRAFPSMSPL